MRQGKKLFTFVEVDANTPIQKLSVLDQFRVLIKKMANDDAAAVRLAEILAVLTYWVLQYFQRISGLYIVETLFAIVFHRSSSITHSGSITLSSYEPHTLLGNSRNGQPR